LHLTYEHVEAIKYSDIGIKLAININSLYLLGELNFEKGSNLLELQQSSEDGFN
ncbi:XRE family transcriptional regulator, partial [Bacillus toyonensis]